MSNLGSIKILGESSIFGGEYNNITVLGQAFSQGNIKCNKLTILGELNIKDELNSNDIKILGQVTTDNKCIVNNNLKILGQLDAKEDFQINKSKVLGQGNFEKSLTFQNINVLGELSVKTNCEGSYFKSSGGINIEGLLCADKIDIDPKRVNIINEIGGSEIIIKKRRWYSIVQGRVISNIIEGDKIILENTNCKVVCGHDITILGGCTIDKIEYTGTLKIYGDSTVGEEICLKN